MNSILTAIIPIVLFLILLPIQPIKNNSTPFFFSKDYTTILKGLCSIIVILVHIPEKYQNIVQDSIGSFAYVCVTLFFLISAYGMSISLNRKGYLKHFWRNKLVTLLTPCLLINIFVYLSRCFLKINDSFQWTSILHIDHYVIQLLGYCLIFYVVHFFYKRKRQHYKGGIQQDIIICSIIFIGSLILYFVNYGWKTECWGLIYGTLLARFYSPFVHLLQKRITLKVVFWGIISIILGIIYIQYKYIYFWGEYCLRIFLGFTIIIFLFYISSKIKFGNFISLYLGRISYEVYLLHNSVMGILIYCGINFSGIFIICTVFVTILLSIIINKFSASIIKKMKS